MSDYIKREDATEAIIDCIRARLNWRTNSYDERQGLNVAMCAIEDVPAADVVERKRGEWIPSKELPWLDCSECGQDSVEYTNYCPNCGADMRRDAGNEKA